eukprot:TRINITY_DN10510_c0_g1_i1.p1 TRINITY_DN10510_c0_g1~~TRINITY_DN10510_c0_g1_i1.p1  ORF type:complete len:319 (+),score=37.51 TRINITY_DN10510_c0_g1_i1:38-958(+)
MDDIFVDLSDEVTSDSVDLYVFLSDCPGQISQKNISNSLPSYLDVVRIDKTAPGKFSIKLPTKEHKNLFLEKFPIVEIKDDSNTLFYLPSLVDGDLPLANTSEIACPICSLDLDGLEDIERAKHVDSCMSQSEGDSGVYYCNDDDGDGLKLLCPFNTCKKLIDLPKFYEHVSQLHSSEPQAHACPICTLIDGAPYEINASTNLLSHLETAHGGVKPVNSTVVAPQPTPTVVSTHSVSHSGGENQAFTIESFKQITENSECAICREEYQPSQPVARLQCLCLFHVDCIKNWFMKTEIKVCPVHKPNM